MAVIKEKICQNIQAGPIFTQSHSTVSDHGLTAMNARDQNNISFLSSLYLFTTCALFPQVLGTSRACLNISEMGYSQQRPITSVYYKRLP